MKLQLKHYLGLLGVVCYTFSFAQKEDYTWITGGSPVLTYTKNIFQFSESGYSQDTIINFDNINMYRTNASLSDSLGKLQFYSSGIALYNNQHEIMPNGDSINPGWIRDLNEGIPGRYTLFNGALALIRPNSLSTYYLIHCTGDSISTGDPAIDNAGVTRHLLYSTIKKNVSGDTFCSEKNLPLVIDTLNNFGVTACRHGNGRDWWLIVGESFTNCYYTLIVTPDTIQQIHKQCLGTKFDYLSSGHSFFSPDGNKFTRTCAVDGIELFDFDRCSGLLSNAKTIGDSSETSLGVGCISPNNRFLYAPVGPVMYQFDLLATDIGASRIEVDSVGSIPFSHGYATMYNAPDGTIIVSSGSFANWNIIHQPNELGVACDFEAAVPILKGGSYGLPNFPNYRLGRLIGSECDTLFNDTVDAVHSLKMENKLDVYPNPANELVRLEYGNFLWQSSDQLSMAITNTIGQVMVNEDLADYSIFKDYNIADWQNGIYWVSLYNKGELIGVRKLVVE